MKKIIFLSAFVCIAFKSMAQSYFPTLDEISFDLKYCGGSIYKHTKKVNINPPPFSQEIELSISHRTYGKRLWERINNCPTPSFNFCFSKYGNQLGNVASFYPGIEWSVLRKEKFNWRFKVGGGIGLASDRWTRQDTLNNYLGSRLNNFTIIQTGLNFQISKNLELQAGSRMSHVSNGAFRSPNFGINLFSGYVGINYYPIAIQKPKTEILSKPSKRSIYLGLRSSVAWGEQNKPDGPLASILTQTIYGATLLKRKHLLFAGVDIAYNKRALSSYKYNMLDGNLPWSATASSLFVGAELRYGKFGIPFQLGVFTKQLRNESSIWYQKFGFQYYFYQKESGFLKNLYFGPMLISNKINADYIEFCLGAMF